MNDKPISVRSAVITSLVTSVTDAVFAWLTGTRAATPRGSANRTMITFATFAAVLLVGIPLTAEAQDRKAYRIGILERTNETVNAANLTGFREGLRDLGYVEGKDVFIDYRSAEGRDERYPRLAAELVRLDVDVILTRGTPATLAAKNATAVTPIVMTGIGDPVGSRIIESLGRPGGNITGLTAQTTDIYAKRVELLKELVPNAIRVGALFNMGNPSIPPQWKQIDSAARSLGLRPILLDVRKRDDLEHAFDAAIKGHVETLVVGLDTLTQQNHQVIVDLAAKHRLPAIYASSTEYPGGLIAYGVDYPHLYRQAARFVDKIFRGAKPAELPVEQPTKFELVINIKTAKALSVTISPALQIRADRFIE
jgi:putative ABC transport system substrate-binding protein